MKNKTRITVITDKRSDALGKYSKSLIQELQNKYNTIDVIVLDNQRFNNRVLNFILEITNTIKILFMVRRNTMLLYTDPLSFNILSSVVLPNKKYTLFYHYENDPFYYAYIPFLLYKEVLNSFNGIICSSRFSVSELRSLGATTEKLKVIYCGIDHNLFKPSLSKLYPFEYILSVGSEEPRKNMKNILNAFQILKKDFPHLKLLKIGAANQRNRTKTLEDVRKLGLSESVVFTDHVEEKALPAIYSNAKLLLFPSLKEGFGLPIVEAMACGCPVVTSNKPPMTELIESGQTTTDPLNPEEIAQACKNILVDSKYREVVIRNGIARAKHFSWKKTAENIYSFITSSQ